MFQPCPRFISLPDVDWFLQYERRWRWLGILVLSLVFALNHPANPLTFWRGWLVSFGIWALYWNANATVFAYFNRRYRHDALSTRRFSWVIGWYLVDIFSVSLISLAVRVALRLPGMAFSGAAYRLVFFESLAPMIMLVAVYESLYFFSAWRQASVRAVNLEKENAISRLEALKQQVDPHFLFNSLNTMAALVDDNEPAQEFLGALASVYRYVLLSRSVPSVPLEQELAFVDNYLLLLRAKLGGQLEVVRDIEAPWLAWHVPPIAVQQVLEYVVKHHSVRPGQPLRITLHADKGYLDIRNSVQPAPKPQLRAEATLQRVVDQFQLLTAVPVTVEAQGAEVAVRLPLLPAP